MLRVGLTGGIGSGKSTVARRLQARGALVVDADRLAREVVATGSPGLAAVTSRFGQGVIGAGGDLDRAALGAVAFADPQALADLERIIHPLVRARTREIVAAAAPEAILVHDVPLLVEKRMGAGYHLVVVVVADEQLRMARLTTTRGLAESDARARIASQATDAERLAAADVLLDNNGSREALLDRVDRLWRDRLTGFNDNLLTGACHERPESPILVPHDRSWAAQADRLIERVRVALGDRAVGIVHIGSTSVADLPAKDVIDLQVGVRRLRDADEPAFVEPLAASGFPRATQIQEDDALPWLPDVTLWQKRFHGSADPGRTVHVHVRPVDGPAWRYALLYRDWLRAVPAERDAYAEHKLGLARSCATTAEYTRAKAPYVTDALRRADAWARRTGWEVA